MLRGNPDRYSVEEIRALADDAGAVVSRAFVDRLSEDPRRAARSLAERLARRLGAADAEIARRERMLQMERRCWSEGARRVAGVDEVGMGPLAGPVVAAAVVLDPERPTCEADDSKVLDRASRERIAADIHATALAVSIGIATVEDIAELDIYRAGLLAMRRAVVGLVPAADRLLVDARRVPDVDVPQEAHVKGDARSCSIAAASIVAKVHRDAIMARLGTEHPGYGFEHHAGYSTPEHLEALRARGPCAAHRKSWLALAEHSGEFGAHFYALKEALRVATDAASFVAWQGAVHEALDHLRPEELRRLDTLARRRFGPLGAREAASAQEPPRLFSI